MIFEILSASAKDFLSFLSKTPFWFLMDLTASDLLPRRYRLVFQNTCKYWYLVYVRNVSQNCILDLFAIWAADFPASGLYARVSHSFRDVRCRPRGGARSTVPHPVWSERPTPIETSQLKWSRIQSVTVDIANLCTMCIFAHLCVGRKFSWCTVRCYSTAEAGGLVNITMLTNHIFLYLWLIYNVCIQVSHEDLGASLVSSSNSWYYGVGFGPYTCNKHSEQSTNFNIHTLPVGFIHRHNLPAADLRLFLCQTGRSVLA